MLVFGLCSIFEKFVSAFANFCSDEGTELWLAQEIQVSASRPNKRLFGDTSQWRHYSSTCEGSAGYSILHTHFLDLMP